MSSCTADYLRALWKNENSFPNHYSLAVLQTMIRPWLSISIWFVKKTESIKIIEFLFTRVLGAISD